MLKVRMKMEYKIIWEYTEEDKVQILDLITNEILYYGSTDTIPNLPEFKSYIISKITLENYNEFLDEYDLDWDYQSAIYTCETCCDWNYDKSGERFGVKYEYSKGCFGEDLTIHADSNESLQDFLTKLNLHVNTFVFGSRQIGEMEEISYDEDVDIWSI